MLQFTISYIIQYCLVIAFWLSLVTGSILWLLRQRQRARTGRLQISDAVTDNAEGERVLRRLLEFHDVQCYFSIAIAIASFFTDPFTTDPINGFGLLPPAITGFLPQIFSLLLARYFSRQTSPQQSPKLNGRFRGSLVLCILSWGVSSAVFWGLYRSLMGQILYPTTEGDDAALRHALSLDACGGSNALALCYQQIGYRPQANLLDFWNPNTGTEIRVSPVVWSWWTFCLILLVTDTIANSSNTATVAVAGFWTVTWSRTKHGNRLPFLHRILTSTPAFVVFSMLFFASVTFQGILFHNYLNLGLMERTSWSFGQIVAIMTWIPLVIRQPMCLYRKS